MQIHEVTLAKKQLAEAGIGSAIKKAAKSAGGAVKSAYKDAKSLSKVGKDFKLDRVAKRAADAWEDYSAELEQFYGSQPTPTPATATASTKPTTPAPGSRIQTPKGAVNKSADGQWKTDAGEVITNPADVAELERRAKQQITLTAQNKQMSPASGIKEAAPATAPGSIAQRSAARNAPVAPAATPAATSAPATRVDALTAFRNRTDGKYEQALKQFVQKNLLSGLPYTRLQNAQEIDNLIKIMSEPANADSEKQWPYWQQLVKAAALADVLPQNLTQKAATASTASTTQGSPQELRDPVVAAEKQDAGVDPATLAKVGQVLRSKFTGNADDISSTGDPAVDALLLAMGFKP